MILTKLTVNFNDFKLGEVDNLREADLLLDCVRDMIREYSFEEAPGGCFKVLVDGVSFVTVESLETAEKLVNELYDKKYKNKGIFFVK